MHKMIRFALIKFLITNSLLLTIFFPNFNHEIVPPDSTFTYTNTGEFGEYTAEYGSNYRVLPISNFPFTLCFYNATPNAFFLAPDLF